MQVAQAIHAFAQSTPDAPAMIYDLKPLGYADFDRMIAAARRTIAAWSLPAGGVVALWIDNIQAGWIADLALRGLGHTTAMIRSADELSGFAGLDVVAVVTLDGEGGARAAPGFARHVLRPADWAFAPGAPLEPPPPSPAGGHILLTSGTTGAYKMLLVDEDFAAADLASLVEIYNTTEAVRRIGGGGLSIHLLSFGLWTMAGYNAPIRRWSVGGCVVIQQGAEILASYRLPGIGFALLTPAALALFLNAPAGALPRNDSLSLMVVGGALSAALAARAKARWTPRLFTALGSTESGVWAITPIESDEDLRWHRIHPSRTVEVVGDDDRPVPAGQLGEVRVRLDNGLAGYLNAPETSAQAFRGGYFHPGDLGVMDGRGRLALHGRMSDVINVAGDKIAAAPLEQALGAALGVEGVCVLSEQGEGQAEELHVVLERPGPIDLQTLTAAAQTHLSGFPHARFHTLAALPRNAMGKVERFKLRNLLFGPPPTA